MIVTLHPTTMIVTLQAGAEGTPVRARVWQGTTDQGTPCHAYIAMIAPTIPQPLPPAVEAEFGDALLAVNVRAPSDELKGIPLRFFID